MTDTEPPADPAVPPGLLAIADADWVVMVRFPDVWLVNNIPLDQVRLQLLEILDGIERLRRERGQ